MPIFAIEDLAALPELVRQKASSSSKSAKDQYTRWAQGLLSSIRLGDQSKLQALCDCYMQGAEVDWRELYKELDLRITSVCGYPMEPERCWEAPKQKKQPKQQPTLSEPLLHSCLVASDLLHVYATSMSEHSHSEVREHMIGERNVLAGTVYVEMLRSAGEKMLQSSQLQINELVFLSPMIFEKDQEREVHVILYRKNETDCEGTIQSRESDDSPWQTHIQAKLSVLTQAAPEKVDVRRLFSRMGENVMDSLPTAVDQMVTTGPRWKVQKGIWLGENEAVTQACMEEEFAHELNLYGLYPSMLDASVNCSSVLNGDCFCLPYYYGSMNIYRPMPGTIYAHTVKNLQNSSSDGEIHVFDIQIFDESGQIIATVKDYAMKKAGERQKKQFFSYQDPLLRTIHWVQDPGSYRSTDFYHPDETTVLVSLEGRCHKRLYQSLKAAAKDRFYELSVCQWPGKNTERKTYIYPEDRQAFVRYFDEFDHRNLSQVIFLLPELPTAPGNEDLISDTEALCQSFFNMIYALASNKALGSLTVNLLVPECGDFVPPLAMVLSGMGKSLFFEYSRLTLRCVLISKNTGEQRLVEELSKNHSHYLIRLDGDKRLIPQITAPDEKKTKPFALRENGCYLITGGTGGIGLAIAEQLVQQQPQIHLILASRSKHLPQEQWAEQREALYQRLHKLQTKAASVRCVQCDVADHRAVKALFAEAPNLSGIIHAAGLAGGGFVLNRKWEDFLQVIRPKVYGTYHLVQYAKKTKPDFLVLFSSYSTVLAVAGQSDYIGANSFLDAYADDPDLHGILKVINWGGWSESGMAFANGVDMIKSPVRFLSDAEGSAAFLQAMEWDASRVLVGNLNYQELAGAYEDYSKVIHFDEDAVTLIRSSEQRNRQTEQYAITVRGKDTPLTPTEERVSQAWAKTLGLREVHYQDRFLEIGGDSLSATYLQKEIEGSFPGTMDITDVFVYPTIESMSAFIDSKIIIEEPIQAPTPAVEQESQVSVEKNEPQEGKENDAEQMRKLLEMLASGQIDVSQAGQLI